MKEWNENVGAKVPWNIESGSWLPLPIPWLPSNSQTGVPPWSHMHETDRRTEDDPVTGNSIGGMPSAVDSSKAEDDSNEEERHDNMVAETAASVHLISSEVMSGETCQEEGTTTDVMDIDVKELTDIGGVGGGSLQGDAATKKSGVGILPDLGIAKHANPVPENVSVVDQSCGLSTGEGPDPGMYQLELSSGACLTMSLSMFPAKDITEEGNEQGGSIASVDLTSSFGHSGEVRENAKLSGISSIRHRQRQLLPKQPQNQQSTPTEAAKEQSPQAPVRVARPPGEGRGRNQLLPRYWPRITDQELQQITSGDSNCTITPLFEKMLSASDAGRIGRLVLPKACAEAYFPPISQPEGLPLKIQDISGKDWVFQFRFWPNNNSRMYVLEGVTPCIQSMNLQAGDTVTFTRLDPEGKLVMGYRRAPTTFSPQDIQPVMASTSTSTGPSSSGGIEKFTNIASFSSLLSQSTKGNTDTHMNGQANLSDTAYGWFKTEKAGSKAKESSFLQSLATVDRKRGRHLGSKSKRLRLEVEDSIELKLSWEEAQDLLRPPPNVAPSILTIEGHEFEEYEEPPVFGKRTIFTARQNGPGEDQWAQCDDCGSWRKVPSDVFLPTRWTCTDNVWDSKRATCSARQEVNTEEIDNLLRRTKDVRKPDGTDGPKVTEASSGLDALATAATLGENNTASSSSPAPTTKHPRHRPGCTCIVCIQPPSGKGPKHKPTCVCNVCMTVKRRFKTLMMRRKKRQSEREAENGRKKRAWVKEEEVNSGTKWQTENYSSPENGSKQANIAPTFPVGVPRINNLSSSGNPFSQNTTLSSSFSSMPGSVGEERLVGKGQIDLNSQPEREDEPGKGTGRMSMVRLLQSATYPLDRYLKQQGLTSLICPQQMVSSIGFARNVGIRRVDELTGSQSAVLNPDRPQEDSYFILGREKGDTASSIQSYDVMERKLATQVSTQGS